MITGYTSSKLDVVQTYSKINPYQIGINGVTKIIDTNGFNYTSSIVLIPSSAITSVYYTIGDINYITNIRNRVTTFSTSLSGYDFEPYSIAINNQNTFDTKEEAKMGMVFPPKVSDEVFIERMGVAVFERQSRLSEIKTLEGLINYRNGYYNITENI